MKLIKEYIDFKDLEVIKEDVETHGEKKKKWKIRGPFLEAENKNRNGRIYSSDLLMREVKKYNEEKIKTNRSMGQLDHPESPMINLDRVSHIIESLEMIDNRGIGVAKILETPMGKIAEALLSDGVILGMSTRGVGSLDGEKVQEDFQMIAVDIVAEPSAQCAFVEGVMENAEWIFKNDEWIQVKVKALKEEVDKVYRSKSRFCKKDVSKETLKLLNSFIKSM